MESIFKMSLRMFEAFGEYTAQFILTVLLFLRAFFGNFEFEPLLNSGIFLITYLTYLLFTYLIYVLFYFSCF